MLVVCRGRSAGLGMGEMEGRAREGDGAKESWRDVEKQFG